MHIPRPRVFILLMATMTGLWSSAIVAAPCTTAGLDLPPGFCATVFASDIGAPRHLDVAANGTVYINLADTVDGHGLMALRDTDGDGVADRQKAFGRGGATGLAIHDGWLYAATLTDIYRYRLGDSLTPEATPQHLVTGMPRQSAHTARGLAIGGDDALFVNIGAPSNACQKNDRTPGSRGQDPCPLLEKHGGIWRFSATETDQPFAVDTRYATGLRNTFALGWHHDRLYGVQHGRDQLHSNWPDRFTQQGNTRLPAEELFAIDKGDHFGWPYCYYDPGTNTKVLAPEYGGDGKRVGRCDGFEDPIAAYPAHWAPMDMLFYDGDQFPRQYRTGVFIAFHGSWNRAPLPQAGYRVIFQPFDGDMPTDDYTTFAGMQGFTGARTIRSPGNAEHRPAGLAQGPDGALYISDDHGGTVFRITYAGA